MEPKVSSCKYLLSTVTNRANVDIERSQKVNMNNHDNNRMDIYTVYIYSTSDADIPRREPRHAQNAVGVNLRALYGNSQRGGHGCENVCNRVDIWGKGGGWENGEMESEGEFSRNFRIGQRFSRNNLNG